MNDILLAEGDNELNVPMPPIALPEFVVSNVSISPSSGLLGEEATLSFKITNTGGVRGDWSVTLRFSVVGGETEWRPWTVNGTLDPGQSEIRDVPLVFHLEAGTWTIRVNEHIVTYEAIFDPWSYDFNGNGLIDTQELLAATDDYNTRIITKEQLDQVTALWEG
ncbi:unnamed protein product [marine sediment metagenome]|uniref:CARDB domain-containing protein n=1 Tax=marine sediment metagenome TaxID=412755 RepID=X1N197_9ZZZZ